MADYRASTATAAGMAGMGFPFPSNENLAALRQKSDKSGYSAFSDEELWRWHAYDFGFRRVFLNDFVTVSPIDPQGVWFNPHFSARTEGFYREKTGRLSKQTIRPPSFADEVRDDWRYIPAHLLTDRERELAMPEIADMSRQFQANMAEISNKKSVFKPKRYADFAGSPAREMAAPVVMPEDIDRLTHELEARKS